MKSSSGKSKKAVRQTQHILDLANYKVVWPKVLTPLATKLASFVFVLKNVPKAKAKMMVEKVQHVLSNAH